MRIIGVSGLAGSGKSLVTEVATERGSMIVSMGDIIRREAKKRGEPYATNGMPNQDRFLASTIWKP